MYVCTRASVYAYAYAYAYVRYGRGARIGKGREEVYKPDVGSRLSSLIQLRDTITKKTRITRRSKKLRGQPQGLPVSLRM